MGKAFEKQIKTIEDQGKKQVDALENLKLKAIETRSNDNKPTIIKEIYNKILEERMDVRNWVRKLIIVIWFIISRV